MPKVTQKLRDTWSQQRAQSLEERTHDQSGCARDPESIASVDFDVLVMDALLALPLGASFDAQDVQRGLMEQSAKLGTWARPTAESLAAEVAAEVEVRDAMEAEYEAERLAENAAELREAGWTVTPPV